MTTIYELPDHEYRTLWHKACQDLERLQAELDNIKEVEFPRRVEYVTEGWRAKCERLQAELDELKSQDRRNENKTNKHTAGPWKVGQYLGSPSTFVIHMDVGDKGRGMDIAFTSTSFGNNETLANARLIAAAPDLLEALQYAVNQVPELADVPGIKKQLEKYNGH